MTCRCLINRDSELLQKILQKNFNSHDLSLTFQNYFSLTFPKNNDSELFQKKKKIQVEINFLPREREREINFLPSER